MGKNTTSRMFWLARASNLARHARRGTLVAHLARKFLIASVLRPLGLGVWLGDDR